MALLLAAVTPTLSLSLSLSLSITLTLFSTPALTLTPTLTPTLSFALPPNLVAPCGTRAGQAARAGGPPVAGRRLATTRLPVPGPRRAIDGHGRSGGANRAGARPRCRRAAGVQGVHRPRHARGRRAEVRPRKNLATTSLRPRCDLAATYTLPLCTAPCAPRVHSTLHPPRGASPSVCTPRTTHTTCIHPMRTPHAYTPCIHLMHTPDAHAHAHAHAYAHAHAHAHAHAISTMATRSMTIVSTDDGLSLTYHGPC